MNPKGELGLRCSYCERSCPYIGALGIETISGLPFIHIPPTTTPNTTKISNVIMGGNNFSYTDACKDKFGICFPSCTPNSMQRYQALNM